MVDREKAFIDQVREMIDDAVGRALTPAITHLHKAAGELRQVQASQDTVLEKVDYLGKQIVNAVSDYDRVSRWATRRGLKDDALERSFAKLEKRVNRLMDVVTPASVETPPRGVKK